MPETQSETYYQNQAGRPLDELLAKQRAERNYVANPGKAAPPDYATGSSLGGAQCNTAAAPGSEKLALHNIDDAMNFQPWQHDQQEAGQIVREALTAAAKAILRSCPDSPFRSVALRNIIDARMNANAAISFRGRF